MDCLMVKENSKQMKAITTTEYLKMAFMKEKVLCNGRMETNMKEYSGTVRCMAKVLLHTKTVMNLMAILRMD